MAEEEVDVARLRKRVDAALRETLDKELADEAVARPGGGDAASFSRSVGIFFSRSYVSDNLRQNEELAMAKNLLDMDESAFKQFADRLATVKEIGARKRS